MTGEQERHWGAIYKLWRRLAARFGYAHPAAQKLHRWLLNN